MNVLLIASSARGHAIAEALHRSGSRPKIFSVSPNRNPGLLALSEEHIMMDIMDFDAVLAFAKRIAPEFAFIGPDDPIGAGLADVLNAAGIPCIAPKKNLARIESSKGFTRELLRTHGIDASPKYHIFTSALLKEIKTYIEDELQGQYVVKYDALKGGKGVKVSGEHLSSVDEGVAYALECIAECGRVVLEEKLIGVEFSLISFVSGTRVADCPAIQDHKRAYAGDTGPNTGGMGTYSDANHSLPFLSQADLGRAKEINRAVATALKQECGEDYKGMLYGGFIAVRDGVRVIEYNARFGDPEALNILPILQSDFVDVCRAVISGELADDGVQFQSKATVCKYITPLGYPENKDQRGEAVSFPAIPANARLYYGDIEAANDGSLLLGGSRAAGIVGIGSTISEAEHIANTVCAQVSGPVRFREDIGTAELVNHRITTLKQLRD
jgi:phosphoribosylamine--glycine ligase